jgi:plastocyanin
MVHITALIASVAILSSRVLAAPLPDSSIDEPGVRAPDGTPITDNPMSTMMNDNNKLNNMKTTTTMMDDNTKTGDKGGKMMGTKTTTMYKNPMSTSSDDSTPTYGSGYNKWNDGYNNCVQQCMNSYGAPPSMYTPPPSTTTYGGNGGGGGGGGGMTHTVLVAPAQGILRYSPFAVNASVGDTIHFIWGGSPHTVTKSSILTPCNKSAEADTFASGVHNKSFEFDLQVNNTDIVTYYCGVPGHCPKGMFGFINPPNAAGTPKSVASMTPSMIANNPQLATQAMYVANKTVGTSAEAWGAHMDMSNVPAELQESFVQNVWQTRLMFAANPGMLEGGMGAANPNGSPITVPADVSQIANNMDPSSTKTNTTSPPAGVGATASSVAPSATSTKKAGGASGKRVASSAAFGVAVLAAFYIL